MKKRICPMCDDMVTGNPCPECGADTDPWPIDAEPLAPARDEAYERAAARDRLDGFARTGGKDWT